MMRRYRVEYAPYGRLKRISVSPNPDILLAFKCNIWYGIPFYFEFIRELKLEQKKHNTIIWRF
jgi:hypothetical protein